MEPIRICFFADGESVHTQRWLREMVVRGFDVTLITRRPGACSDFAVHVVEPGQDSAGWFRGVPAVRRIVRALRPHIVHGHYITSYGMWAAVSGVRPLVLTAWGTDILVSPRHSQLIRWLTGWILRQAALLTADSADTLEAMRGYAPRGRLEQVQWGVDLQRIHAKADYGRQGLNIISLRSWTPNYNIELILRAFAMLLAAQPGSDARLHLLGGGELESTLRELSESLGISAQVIFHGMVNEDRLLELLAQSDISVSVPASDATAMSLLESMAAGLPVVVSDLKANRQWVDDTGGRIVPAGDAAAIANALSELAGDVALRQRMGGRNRAAVEKRASRQSEMDRMAQLYKTLVRSRS